MPNNIEDVLIHEQLDIEPEEPFEEFLEDEEEDEEDEIPERIPQNRDEVGWNVVQPLREEEGVRYNFGVDPANVFQDPPVIRNRGRGGRVVAIDGNEIPAIIADQEINERIAGFYQEFKKADVKVKKNLFLPGGYSYGGYMFSRPLTSSEKLYLDLKGYSATIGRYPELFFKEKEVPINDTEECIVLLSELADFYATLECKSKNANFEVSTSNEDYQKAYTKHIKIISDFKRNKNG